MSIITLTLNNFHFSIAKIMLKLFQEMRTLSRCPTIQTLYHHPCLRINQYSSKPSADEIIKQKQEITKWVESMDEADQKRIRYIQNEV